MKHKTGQNPWQRLGLQVIYYGSNIYIFTTSFHLFMENLIYKHFHLSVTGIINKNMSPQKKKITKILERSTQV